jgi:CHAT domain-containing protein
VEIRRITASLSGETVISYAQLPGGLAVWAFDNRGIRFARTSADARPLAIRFSQLCADPRSDPLLLRETGSRLYSLALEPVLRHLDLNPALVIEVDGPVSAVPFEALPLPDGSPLGRRYRVVLSPGVYYRHKPTPQSEGHPLVVGAPALPPPLTEAFPPLPDALAEAENVVRQLPAATLLTGAAASLSAVERALPTTSIFHFAGHALFAASQSALLLAGTSRQYLDASCLTPGSLARCRLMVLSGCSTGRLEQSALSDRNNLVRAALAAGAHQVVASRWNVDSKATQILFEHFYRELRREDDASGALRAVQAYLQSRSETSHPYYWSAFTTFGSR